ncbi:protein kinase [Leishmania donovani]|uniref:Protein kinase domain family protein n=1 Tax=Leishmania donovani TaxID=5661 RepID=A0A504X0L0_LEIDO|nr:Protein kinase domain family protein [Leishmania donovani]CAJ1988274.1 protein kinase [Leishmania donovani]VDZ44159.1 protein_kinase_putative/GeneDB:LmjF.19.1470 [Leishmania donovani]
MGSQSGKASLSTSNRRRAVCDLCGTKATRKSSLQTGSTLVLKQCSRCHLRCCGECYVWRRYGSSFSTCYDEEHAVAEFAPVCRRCVAGPNLVANAPRFVWNKIFEYCDATAKHHLLQLCHATQMGVVLPYPHTRYGWSTFFEGRHFISKGANGEVYHTVVRRDITKELARSLIDALDAKVLADLSGRAVAVKAIRKSTVFSLRRWKHIQREVDTLRRCCHRHVVQLHFVAQGPSEVYIVLQYVAGGDLFDWLVRQQIPMEYDVVVIARQLLETLHFMHEVCGVVHRDIKPENILLQPVANPDVQRQGDGSLGADDGRSTEHTNSSDDLYIRLADFGYAKLLPQNEAGDATLSPAQISRPPLPPVPADAIGIVGPRAENVQRTEPRAKACKPLLISSTPCGTLGFAAPEILSAYNARKDALQRPRSNRQSAEQLGDAAKPRTPVDLVKRMDIFAAGVTICILLTGCEPFPCRSSKEHIEAVHEGLDFSGPQWNYVSQPAKNLLRRMLAPRAADRPSAFECLNSSWMKHQGPYTDATSEVEDDDENARGKGLNRSASVWQLLSTSFQNSVHSLRKNEGWLFVQDAQGLVTTIPRQLVNGREDSESFSEALHSPNSCEQASTVY